MLKHREQIIAVCPS